MEVWTQNPQCLLSDKSRIWAQHLSHYGLRASSLPNAHVWGNLAFFWCCCSLWSEDPAPSGYQYAAFARKRLSGAYLFLSAEHFTSAWSKRGKLCPAELLLLGLMWEGSVRLSTCFWWHWAGRWGRNGINAWVIDKKELVALIRSLIRRCGVKGCLHGLCQQHNLEMK